MNARPQSICVKGGYHAVIIGASSRRDMGESVEPDLILWQSQRLYETRQEANDAAQNIYDKTISRLFTWAEGL